MLLNRLNITLRFFKRSKVTTSINFLGIVTGLSVSILLMLYVKKELETDKFHGNIGNIFRFETSYSRNMSVPRINIVKESVPEVKHITYFHGSWSFENLVKYNNKLIKLENVLNADSAFFRVFGFKVLEGDTYNSLTKPNSLVLTQSEALKIFGKEKALGKKVMLLSSEFEKEEYTVTAVIDDLPQNSSISFKSIISLSSFMKVDWYRQNAMHWGTHNYQSFALLNENADSKAVEKKIETLINQQAPDWDGNTTKYLLNSFDGLYFNQDYGDEYIRAGKKSLVYLLGTIGILILIIACINYFNLSMGQTEKRLKEVGVKKTMGATGKHLFMQSLSETMIIFVAALVISYFLIRICLPYFNNITFSNFSFQDIIKTSNIILILFLFAFSVFLFALFPAMSLSRMKAVNVFHGKIFSSGKFGFKNGLIIFQFTITLILLISTMMLWKQNYYMINTDYGYEKENIVYLYLNKDMIDKTDFVQEEFLKHSNIDKVALGSDVLGNVGSNWGLDLYHNNKTTHINFQMMFCDKNFLDLFNLNLINGENFNEASSQKEDVIFNKTLIENFEIEDILNTQISIGDDKGYIVGIVEDFNLNSLREPIKPFGFICSKNECSVMYVKMATGNLATTKATLDYMAGIWNKVSPDYPFEYEFIDQQYKSIYQGELHFFKIFMIASALSILIACLGLFGVAYNVMVKKTKEIGVRKVNGAAISDIILLLNREFIINVIIALAISIPSTYFFISLWLENYAYKTELSWWIFAMGGLLAAFVSFLTVSFQSWWAARRNPVEALRYE